MKHFLVTRFNLRVEEWEITRNGDQVLSENWLKNRFNLFENYCLPSVINQTNQDFTWCVFFDTNTPKKYRNKINTISLLYPNLHPIFIDGKKELIDSLIEYIEHNLTEMDEYIITTRLDNDDLIHKDFIKTIQQLFEPKDKTVIDLRKGYQVTLRNNHSEIRDRVNYFNPFISLIEKTKNINTVFSKHHKDWKSSNSVIAFETVRLWVELVHQGNMSNYTKENMKRIFHIKNLDFGLSKESEFKEQPISVFISNLKIYVIYYFNLFSPGNS